MQLRSQYRVFLGIVFFVTGLLVLCFPAKVSVPLESVGLSQVSASVTASVVSIVHIYVGTILLVGRLHTMAVRSATVCLATYSLWFWFFSTLANPGKFSGTALLFVFEVARTQTVVPMSTCVGLLIMLSFFLEKTDRKRLD